MTTEDKAEEGDEGFELQWLGEPHHTDVQYGCARCGTEKHEDLTYLPITYPIDFGDGFIATHFVPCPTNGEPILLCQGRPRCDQREAPLLTRTSATRSAADDRGKTLLH